MLGSSSLHPNSSSWALKIPVGDIIMHPKYWGRNFIRSDIALLSLEIPVTFNKYVQPICLPEHNFNLKVGMKCWMTGWGQLKQHSPGELDGLGTPPLWVFIVPSPVVPLKRLWLWSFFIWCLSSWFTQHCSKAETAWAGRHDHLPFREKQQLGNHQVTPPSLLPSLPPWPQLKQLPHERKSQNRALEVSSTEADRASVEEARCMDECHL